MVFDENTGKQCLAMSLTALIYNTIKGIHSCNGLVQIMEMGDQLYREGVFHVNIIIVNDFYI